MPEKPLVSYKALKQKQKEEAASYIAICSEAALKSLVFTNASFVSQ